MEEIKNTNGKGTGVFRCTRVVNINGKNVEQQYLYQPPKIKGGRKRFGPGTAKNYNDRKGAFLLTTEQINEQRLKRGQKI